MTTSKIVEATGSLFRVTKSSAGNDFWTPLTMSEAAAELTTWKERAAAGEQRIIELQTRVVDLTAQLEAAHDAIDALTHGLAYVEMKDEIARLTAALQRIATGEYTMGEAMGFAELVLQGKTVEQADSDERNWWRVVSTATPPTGLDDDMA